MGRTPVLTQEDIGDVHVVTAPAIFTDEGDLARAGEELLTCIHAGHRKLLLDVTHVVEFNSSAIGKILAANRAMSRARGQLVVCANAALRSVFEVLKLPTFITIVESKEAAFRLF